MIGKYQSEFPLYDRFLPILCEKLEGLIIDVGANIGDTALAVFSKNEKSFIVGVEPDESFFSECQDNIIRNSLSQRFFGVKKFLTTNKGSYEIEKSNNLSTGSISKELVNNAEINTISFSELMKLIPSEKKAKFEILKIDTDGFDWDVINSFVEYLNVSDLKPRFVFFEMQTYQNNVGIFDRNRETIINNYKLAIEELCKQGYEWFYILDNFGTPVKLTNSIADIFEVHEYIKNSQVFNSHSIIYYLDILAFTANDLKFVKDSVNRLYESVV